MSGRPSQHAMPSPVSTGGTPTVRAWQPDVAGIAEVFHARFVGHAYPLHTHDSWSLLILDDGAIRYDLDRRHHGAVGASVTLLPPHVTHDGRAATPRGFRKRVLYLDTSVLSDDLIGAAVDRPDRVDAVLRDHVHRLHLALAHPGDELEAETRLAMIRDQLHLHLTSSPPSGREPPEPRLADHLRDLLDSRLTSGLTLREAAHELHAHPTHLVRAFSAAFGLPPHAYLTGRRVDHARRLLLTGRRPADVAVAAGFYDQAHLTRHFKRYLGVTPARFAATTRLDFERTRSGRVPA